MSANNASGFVGHLSQKQTEALEKFREKVADLLPPEKIKDDHYLLRWLRARQFDVGKAEKMIRTSMQWRKEWDIDNILTNYEPCEVVLKYYTGGFSGFDKDGCLVWIDAFGRIDLKGICYSAKKRDILKTQVYQVEKNITRMEEQSRKLNKRCDQLCFIFDLTNLSWRHMWKPGVDLFCSLIQIVEDNYPEMLKVNYIVNAPKYFPVAFNLVKPFLSEDTIKKMRVYGTNGWKEALLEDIDADQLPVHYGGTQTGPGGDPMCKHKICYGGRVPESYPLRKQSSFDTSNAQIREVFVGRAAETSVQVDIPRADTVLRWEFKTDCHDIGFGLYFSSTTGAPLEELLPVKRVNCHLVMEDGTYTCKRAGIYHVKFDNSFSWLRGKKVFYILEHIAPVDNNGGPAVEAND